MQLGMIGLGRMGGNRVRRLLRAGHQCVAFARNADSVKQVPPLTTSLFQRFASRGEDDFASKLLSAMRFQFGGHLEKPAGAK